MLTFYDLYKVYEDSWNLVLGRLLNVYKEECDKALFYYKYFSLLKHVEADESNLCICFVHIKESTDFPYSTYLKDRNGDEWDIHNIATPELLGAEIHDDTLEKTPALDVFINIFYDKFNIDVLKDSFEKGKNGKQYKQFRYST